MLRSFGASFYVECLMVRRRLQRDILEAVRGHIAADRIPDLNREVDSQSCIDSRSQQSSSPLPRSLHHSYHSRTDTPATCRCLLATNLFIQWTQRLDASILRLSRSAS